MSNQSWRVVAVHNAEAVIRLSKDKIIRRDPFGGFQRTAEYITSQLDVCLQDIARFISQPNIDIDDMLLVFKSEMIGQVLLEVIQHFEMIVRLELCRDEQNEIVDSFLALNSGRDPHRQQFEITRDYLVAEKTICNNAYQVALGEDQLEKWNEMLEEAKVILKRRDAGEVVPLEANGIIDYDYDSSNGESENEDNGREADAALADDNNSANGNNDDDDDDEDEEEEDEDLSALLRAVLSSVPNDRSPADRGLKQEVLRIAQKYETQRINQGLPTNNEIAEITNDLHFRALQRELENRAFCLRIRYILTWIEGGSYKKTKPGGR